MPTSKGYIIRPIKVKNIFRGGENTQHMLKTKSEHDTSIFLKLVHDMITMHMYVLTSKCSRIQHQSHFTFKKHTRLPSMSDDII